MARSLPLEPDFTPAPASRPRTGTRAGRSAVERRRVRGRRRRYARFVRTLAAVGIVTLGVCLYLALLANVTRMNYDLMKVEATKARLVADSGRLDDRIASLESRERLANLALRLGMREPQTFIAIAAPSAAPPSPPGLAFLDWLR